MQLLQGGLGAETGLKAPADRRDKLHEVKRPKASGFVAGSLEAKSFQREASSQRPPRTAAGGAEITVLDSDGVIVGVNQTWRDTLDAHGLTLPDAGIGLDYVDLAHRFLPDLDRERLQLVLDRLLSGEVDEFRRTYAIQTPGGPRWRQVQITPLLIGSTGRFVAIHDDLTNLAVAQEALKVTSEQLLNARDDERERIALELHDSTLQHLTVISFGLAKLKRSKAGSRSGDILEEMTTALNEAVKETRVLSYLMKPRGLARSGLAATVQQFLEGFARRTGLQVRLKADAAVDRTPPPLQHAALRIVQEAMMNANRHAQAKRVSVELAMDAGQLTVTIADDGRGMTTRQGGPLHGVGIPGMQARAQQFSGELEIESSAGGTRVTAWLPLA